MEFHLSSHLVAVVMFNIMTTFDLSLSDKLARWNVIGVQGALLSHLVEPIYLYSISLGSLFHPHHLYRALAGRIEGSISGLPPPYRLNMPRYLAVLRVQLSR